MKRIFLFIAFIASYACHADNWMKDINDGTKLCRISIPGTHDAGTGNGFEGILAILGPTTAQTQELDLAAQWDAGVRAFDLRPKLSFGQLKIFHGVIETRLTFDNALKTICQKLTENPSECAIVLMQNEGSSLTSDEEWGSYVAESMKKVQEYLIDYSPSMSLGAARGKLLIMNRSLFRPIPHGCVLQGWGVNQSNKEGSIESASGTKGTFHVQDFYIVTDEGAPDQKKQYVKDMLDMSNTSANDDMFFNFTSGYTFPASIDGICDNAHNTNTYLTDLLEDASNEFCSTGIVFMDFAGVDTFNYTEVNGKKLLSAVIDCNSKLPTTIANAIVNVTDNYAYGINGMRISKKTKGIVIINGRKYIR